MPVLFCIIENQQYRHIATAHEDKAIEGCRQILMEPRAYRDYMSTRVTYLARSTMRAKSRPRRIRVGSRAEAATTSTRQSWSNVTTPLERLCGEEYPTKDWRQNQWVIYCCCL